MSKKLLTTIAVTALLSMCFEPSLRADAPEGFVSLFNGRDLTGWKVPEGDNGHWKVEDGVIDYDAKSEAGRDKNLWTGKQYRDFVLRIDWRLKSAPVIYKGPIVLPDGSEK